MAKSETIRELEPPGLRSVTASAGIALFNGSGTTDDEMMVRADRAMYEAKEQAGNGAAVYAAHREFDIVEPGRDSIVIIRTFVSGEGELEHHRCPGEGSFLRLWVPVLDR